MINRSKFALTFGYFAAVMHVIWSVLVGLGVAQTIMDFVYRMHFMENPYTVAEFSWGTAVGLVVMAFIVAYAISSLFATIWNKVHGK